jgi:hypothetical protein
VFIAGTSYCALTADSGTYTISDVPAGSGYVLVANKQGYDSAITSVAVTAGETTAATALNLATHVEAPTKGSVSGTVRLNGGPTGNAGIFVFLAGTSFITISDDAGSYCLSAVAPGVYTLVASKEGYVSAATSVSVVAGDSTIATALDLSGVQVSAPIFIPGTGAYISDQLVTISDAIPGATIYYTIDGSSPTPSSPTYTTPIMISGNGSNAVITIKALAAKAGMSESPISEATYSLAYPALAVHWGQTVSAATNDSTFFAIAPDALGNVYAVGYIYFRLSAFTFGPGATATGTYTDRNLVIVKYNTIGVAQWAQTVTGPSHETCFLAVATDANGNAYAAGYISNNDNYNFGGMVSAAGTSSGKNLALVKYNPSGVAQWARTISAGTSDSCFNSVAVDGNNVYAAGYITGTETYNLGGSCTAKGGYSGSNAIMAKYSVEGVAQWAQTAGTAPSASIFNSVAVASDHNIYAAGAINGTGTYNFGGTVEATGGAGSNNVLLVRYNSSGAAQWAKTINSGASASSFNSVAVDADRNAYVAGFITGTGAYNFGDDVTATGRYGGANVLLVKYSSSGVAQWAQTAYAGGTASSFSSVCTDLDRNVYVAGYLFGTRTIDFGGSVAVAGTYSTGNNAVLLKYNEFGIAQWARAVSMGVGNSYFNSVAADGTWSLYTAGYITGTGIFSFGGSVRLSAPHAGSNVLLVKYSE